MTVDLKWAILYQLFVIRRGSELSKIERIFNLNPSNMAWVLIKSLPSRALRVQFKYFPVFPYDICSPLFYDSLARTILLLVLAVKLMVMKRDSFVSSLSLFLWPTHSHFKDTHKFSLHLCLRTSFESCILLRHCWKLYSSRNNNSDFWMAINWELCNIN